MWASKVARGLSRRVSRARSSGLGASSAMPVATHVLVRSMSTALSTSSLGRDSEAIERFANTVDLLSYYASKKEMGPSQMDGIGMVTILKQLASVGKGSDVTAMLADGRFHSLLSDLTGKLEDLEARYVVTAASSVAAFRTTTQELTEFTSALAEVVQRRPNAFTPNALSSLTLAFAARRFEDEELVYFVTQECKKVVSEAKCFDLILLLDGLNRWGVFDREIVDMSVERLCDQLDRFTSRDVTHLLGVMGQMALARGFLIRSVAKMMFENLHQFTPRQLCSSLYALVRLRFTTKDQVLQVFRVLEPEASIIPMASVSELIFVSASHGITPTDNKFVKHLCDRFVGMNKNRAEGDDPKVSKKGDKGIESRPLNSLIDVAWAFCVFKDRPHDLKNITERIFSLPVPRSRLMLAKMFEVFGSLKLKNNV